jgi:aspartate/methionine/tyrosine aminotransferase
MIRVPGTPYIAWAKQKKATWNLAVSGAPHAAWADIGGAPADMPFSGENHDGYPPLVERIAERHRVRASHVVTATGCSMANFLVLAALIEPGDEVVIERPTYQPLLFAALHLQAVVRRFERPAERGFAIDPEQVAGQLSPRTRAVVLSNLHNPSSAHVGGDVLRAIGLAAERVGARVIVDEVYLDAAANPLTCLELGPAFVSTSSLTKVYGLAALRCGWVLADPVLAMRLRRLNDLYENVRPFAPDWLAARAFDHLPRLGATTRALVDTNRAVFSEWSRERDDIELTLPRWGTTVCVRPVRADATRLADDLHTRYDVSVVPGHFFEAPDHVRIALCTDTAVLREGLRRIGQCLDAC